MSAIAASLAPGVYYQTVDAGAPPVTPLRTDITGFVGLAPRGPVDLPVSVQSWHQFSSWFGGITGVGYLAYAVRAFFENGGRRCWVVRVAAREEPAGAAASVVDVAGAGGPVWRLRASSPGAWGDTLSCTLRERNPGQVLASTTDPDGRWSAVSTTSGFRRGSHVRVSQGATVAWKVVSDVDPHRRLLHWTHPDPAQQLPYDRPLAGFDLGRPLVVQSVEYALTVHESGRLVRFYDGLSLVPEAPGYGPSRLAPPRPAFDSATGAFVAPPPEPVVIEELRTDLTDLRGLDADPTRVLRPAGGRDGLATLTVDDFVGQPVATDDGPEAVAAKRRGLRALEEIDEIGLLAVPDAQVRPTEPHAVAPEPCVPDPCLDNPPPLPAPPPRPVPEQPPTFGPEELFRIQSEAVLQCERRRYRFALLDPPLAAATQSMEGVRGALDWRSRFESTFAALWFPWLRVVDPAAALAGSGSAPSRLVPPCGHVAGTVAATDLAAGVHRAPANCRIEWAVDASLAVGEEEHAVLNAAGINALRSLGGRGLRAMGARTVTSDPDWWFLNVRRLLSMIEKALEHALQWVVFEPNEDLTRARVTMSVTIFLLGLHEAGMLAGATPEESFYVKCDLDNNPPESRHLGRLVVEIGVAPSKPFEFVVVRVGRVGDALEIADGTGG